MANPTTNYGFVMPSPTDLVTDLPADFDVFGQAVDTQMLTNANAAIAKTIVDAKGDLIGATAADTPARLAVGANGTVLTADSAEATGLKWATAGGGGKVLQVVSASSTTSTNIASTTYTDSGLSCSITPTSATSKILVLTTQMTETYRAAGRSVYGIRLLRDATNIGSFGTAAGVSYGFDSNNHLGVIIQYGFNNINYLDSPATTSAVTYKTQGACETTANGSSITFQTSSLVGQMILLEIGA